MSITKQNNAIVKALKKISETKWAGNIVFENVETCLTSINLESASNSGWYNPTAIRISGLSGIYMINQDGSIYPVARIIKEDEKKYKIEYLTTTGYNEFETLCIRYITDDQDHS